MASRRLFYQAVLGLLSLLLVLPLGSVSAWPTNVPAARAATDSIDLTSSESDVFYDDLEAETDNPGAHTMTTIDELIWVLEASEAKTFRQPIVDTNNLINGKVDVRVTDYLLNLMMPPELGGAGLDHIQVSRLLKNYDTKGIGKLDREYAGSSEEGASAISTHNRGQAVDISEVGTITCKVVQKNKIGSKKTNWLAPQPVKVAWQSQDGQKTNPPPTNPSLVEMAGTLSTDSFIAAFNESGEADAYVDFAKGLDFDTMFTYVGANVLLKNLGLDKIAVDPLSGSLVSIIGANTIAKALPDLPNGWAMQNPDDDIRVATAKADIESRLGLPSGSLRGTGWKVLLENSGKRVLENALGLPSLYLESYSLDDLNRETAAQGAFDFLSQKNEAFNLPAGTLEKIRAKDKNGLLLAGVNAVSSAFRLSPDQKAVLEKAARDSTVPVINVDTLPITQEVPLDEVRGFVTEKPDEASQVLASLKDQGLEILKQAVKKRAGQKYEGVTDQLIAKILNPKEKVTLDTTKETVGKQKLAVETDLSPNDSNGWLKSQAQNSAIAKFLNEQFSLTGASEIQSADLEKANTKKEFAVIQKIASSQVDRVMHWSGGTAMGVISGKTPIAEAVKTILPSRLGELLNIDATGLTLTGDVPLNYGRATLETALGLDKGSLKTNPAITSPEAATIREGFGLNEGDDLTALRQNESYWDDEDRQYEWELTDARLGLSPGTTRKFLKEGTSLDELARPAGKDGLASITLDAAWSYFGLEDKYRLDEQQGKLILKVLGDWDGVSVNDKISFLDLGTQLITRSLDAKAGFDVGGLYSIVTSGTGQERTQALLKQGVKLVAKSLGQKIESFSDEEADNLTTVIMNSFNGKAGDKEALTKFFQTAAGIPDEYKDDAGAIARGDMTVAMMAWTSSSWTSFANQYLPPEEKMSYADSRKMFTVTDQAAINQRAEELYAATPSLSITEYQVLPDSDPAKIEYRNRARKTLMEDGRRDIQYRLSDAMLMKAGITIPANFTSTMMSGDAKQRAGAVESVVFAGLEKYLRIADGRIEVGTLEKIYRGEIPVTDALTELLAKSNIDLGPFSLDSARYFVNFLTDHRGTNPYTDTRMQGVWGEVNIWLGSELGIGDLPNSFAQSVFYSSQNGWDFNASLSQNGQTVIPSLTSMGQDFFTARLGMWGDKALNLPAGSTWQFYQASNKVAQASAALARTNTSAEQIVARKNLAGAQKELVLLAITVALQNCAACQKLFASVDSAISAPPGFTNMAVAGAIAFWMHLGPAGLYMAAAYFFVGWSSSKYLCPIPPPDIYATPGYDPSYDVLDYKWGDYYDDPNRPVESSPLPGETAWDWTKRVEKEGNAVAFADGNDPLLWMAWSRYFTGKLISETINYGAHNPSPYKPKQISTLRAANVYNFAPLSKEAFGEFESGNQMVGLGYTQDSTKTASWVHVAFGGVF